MQPRSPATNGVVGSTSIPFIPLDVALRYPRASCSTGVALCNVRDASDGHDLVHRRSRERLAQRAYYPKEVHCEGVGQPLQRANATAGLPDADKPPPGATTRKIYPWDRFDRQAGPRRCTP